MTGSWKWSGDGTEKSVPGIGRDGEAGTERDNGDSTGEDGGRRNIKVLGILYVV